MTKKKWRRGRGNKEERGRRIKKEKGGGNWNNKVFIRTLQVAALPSLLSKFQA